MLELRNIWILGKYCSNYVVRLSVRKIRSTVVVRTLVIDVPPIENFFSATGTLWPSCVGGDKVLGEMSEERLTLTGIDCMALYRNCAAGVLLKIIL
jgi:hypothetical protein